MDKLIELLPLPEKSEIDRHLPTGVRVYGYTADDMKTYARACVAHATTAQAAEIARAGHNGLGNTMTMTTDYDVVNVLREYHYDPVLVDAANEIEALRNERDFLVEEYERAVGCGPQGYTHAAVHLFNAITNAQADQNAKVIVALRAEVERLTGCLATANANHEQFERQWYLERDRAERLEEALREAEKDLRQLSVINCGCKPCRRACRTGKGAEWELESRMETARAAANKARAALHPTAVQDGK